MGNLTTEAEGEEMMEILAERGIPRRATPNQ